MTLEVSFHWVEQELTDKLDGKINVEKVKISDSVGKSGTFKFMSLGGKLRATDVYYLNIPIKGKYVKNMAAEIPVAAVTRLRGPPVEQLFTFRVGTVVNVSVPSTIVVKMVPKSFFSIKYAFLPYVESNIKEGKFDKDKVWKEKKEWNPLLKKLNSDEELEKMMNKIPKVHKESNIKFDVGDTFCQIIPSKNKTAILIPIVPKFDWGFTKLNKIIFSMDKVLEAMEKIVEHLTDNNFTESVEGLIEKKWSLLNHLIG